MKPITPAEPPAQPVPAPVAPLRIDLTQSLYQTGMALAPGQRVLVTEPVAGQIHALLAALGDSTNIPQTVLAIMARGEDRQAFHGALELMRAGIIEGPLQSGDHLSQEWLEIFIKQARDPGPEAGLQAMTISERLAVLQYAGANLHHPMLLIGAARKEPANALRALLDLGVDIHIEDSEGCNALHLACGDNDIVAAHTLITHGADINRTSSDPNVGTPLMVATGGGHLPMITYLTCTGANPNAGADGRTALHEAALIGRAHAITFLIGKGADPRATCELGRTPLHEIDAGVCGDPRGVVAALAREGADINATDHEQATALHLCAGRGLEEAVIALLETGKARVNAQEAEGRTALHLAARNGNGVILSELMQAGGRLNIRDHRGRTPVDVAPRWLKARLRALQSPASSTTTHSGESPPAPR